VIDDAGDCVPECVVLQRSGDVCVQVQRVHNGIWR
jgi:hypothetical protein